MKPANVNLSIETKYNGFSERNTTMLAKYNIEYGVPFGHREHRQHFATDDPIAAKEFVSELLERGLRIHAIHHEGVDLPPKDFDALLKSAAAMLAARRLCVSLGIKSEEEKYRFGFTA
jgi:hypothetical protein